MLRVLGCALLLTVSATARAQERSLLDLPLGGDATVFAHPDGPVWLSGQLNVVSQYQPGFPARYFGPNSLSSNEEAATSYVATAFGGLRLTRTTELMVDLESAGGGGLSQALGLAGFTNLDVVRNPTLGSAPYVARVMLHQIIPLGGDEVDAERGPFSGFARLPERRLDLRAGKFGTADFFDANRYASDSHLQFLNWAVDNDAAYDYAADTRGYTFGAIVEYDQPDLAVRASAAMMPAVANGSTFDTDLSLARGQSLEVELHRSVFSAGPSVLRVLGFWNLARMGSYAEANAAARLDGAVPDITAHRAAGRSTVGGELNLEQPIAAEVALFGRIGANDGASESFAYTECNDSLELGAWAGGVRWGRPLDRTGFAAVSNGLSAGHRTYLALGGQGFLLGDGALHYGRETLGELFYTLALGHGLFAAADVQGIADPGYNRDRGPVLVAGLRLHAEL